MRTFGHWDLRASVDLKEVSTLHVDRGKVHNLARSTLSSKEMEQRKIDDIAVCELRKKLLQELEKLFPPPITLLENRMEHLVETAVLSQIDSCMYHNLSDAVSLYADHFYDVLLLEDSHTHEHMFHLMQILTEHKEGAGER
ncbi:WD repeat-containing protein WDS homolog isoform X2 [Malus domestica]|uniref:WD repeat-containing protein WDS homolog isoform X2 n=1 Tax=Malus domestica TaxID=3750 RepID=UPI0010AAFE82|nr:WD repeat-containing protein WDS homolog isoform X2 [Malus domestica]